MSETTTPLPSGVDADSVEDVRLDGDEIVVETREVAVLVFESNFGNTIAVDPEHEFTIETAPEASNSYVVWLNEAAVVDGTPNERDTLGDWERDWYFNELRLETQ